ncbi:UDP-glucose 4-epimerase GalE [Rhodoplanes sp. Z2-YC6860]|uniref:UDP-glucose 4-epimerase GalE n=1 Tax=Rhodoplanes sp. Z2-YC6860 TaxID=674703 RepID=UPI00078E7E4C|nr:UDP-glucose 4-epimerase GalE [Rhodoplanes sp. Z2-YC6860]AMN43467.1 UDP-glucose 4-epimerase [Rhodoplanes sp. Z2-YC6860]
MSSASHILVTGGAGFIGSHASKALAQRGFVPVVYDNLSRGHRDLVKFGPLEVGDIGDGARVRAVLEKYRPVAVMHFAAFAYVGESVEHPELYQRNNVLGSKGLLEALLQYKPLPFVFSSTCATYGMPKHIPITEEHPQQPINPYGETKLKVEGMLRDLGRTRGLPWIALRYFNAAGSDPEGEIGEIHDPETHLIPLMLMAARDGATAKIFGADYDTPDGTCIRDYVHVSDIADAHVRAIDYLMAGGASAALNLANSRGHSVKEVIAECERVSGRAIAREITPRRPGDPASLIGSAVRAREVLGWVPQRSALEMQIADAWRWLGSRSR